MENRFTAESQPDGVEVVIHASHGVAMSCLFAMGLAIWAFCGVPLFQALPDFPPVVVFIPAWAGVGIAIVYHGLWRTRGQEQVLLRNGELALRRVLLGTQHFEVCLALQRIRRLRVIGTFGREADPDRGRSGTFVSVKRWAWTAGPIAIEVDGEVYRLGQSLGEDDATRVVAVLLPFIPPATTRDYTAEVADSTRIEWNETSERLQVTIRSPRRLELLLWSPLLFLCGLAISWDPNRWSDFAKFLLLLMALLTAYSWLWTAVGFERLVLRQGILTISRVIFGVPHRTIEFAIPEIESLRPTGSLPAMFTMPELQHVRHPLGSGTITCRTHGRQIHFGLNLSEPEATHLVHRLQPQLRVASERQLSLSSDRSSREIDK